MIHCSRERKVIEGIIYIGKIALKKKKLKQHTQHSDSKRVSYQTTRELNKGCRGLEGQTDMGSDERWGRDLKTGKNEQYQKTPK